MCAMQVFTVGEVLSASDTNEFLVNTRFVLKPNDTSRSTNTTLTADPDLTLPVDASKIYELECFIQSTAAAGSGDIKCNWAAPAGAVFNGQATGIAIGGSFTSYPYQATANLLGTSVNFAGGGAFALSFRVSGILVMSTTAGSLTFQWSQNTSSATATIVKQGSSMVLRRVS